jgi:hypothetical protein
MGEVPMNPEVNSPISFTSNSKMKKKMWDKIFSEHVKYVLQEAF